MRIDERPWAAQAVLCFLATLAYAVVRYHVFGDVAWAQLPLYTLNKAVSFTAAILLAAAYLFRRRGFGLAGFALALLHVLMSFALLTEANYPKLFAAGRYTLEGGLCVLAGCLGVLALFAPAAASAPGIRTALPAERWRQWQRAGYAALAAAFFHVLFLGWRGWFTPAAWPGGLPPITMLSCIVLALPLLAKARRISR